MVFDGRTIDFMELQVFAAVARHGGVTAAADALGISKSTVSLQITRLEDRLGTRLLVRSSRRVALTREGEQVLPRVQSLLAEAENLLEEASRASAAPRGIVRIAVSPPLGGAMLELLVPALRDRYPDVSLIVVPSYEMDDLQDPSFDFAIRVGRIQDDTLIANKIGEFSRILVCAPSYPLAGANSVELLRKEDLLAFGGRVNQRKFAAQEIALDSDPQFSVADFDMLVRLSRAGYGIVEVPDFLVRTDIAEGRLVRVLPDWRSAPLDVILAYRVGVSRINRVAAVLNEVEWAVTAVLQGGTQTLGDRVTLDNQSVNEAPAARFRKASKVPYPARRK